MPIRNDCLKKHLQHILQHRIHMGPINGAHEAYVEGDAIVMHIISTRHMFISTSMGPIVGLCLWFTLPSALGT